MQVKDMHASVAERFHIMLLFNSDRVIDLALSMCVTHVYTHINTYVYSRLRLLR